MLDGTHDRRSAFARREISKKRQRNGKAVEYGAARRGLASVLNLAVCPHRD